MMTPGQKGRGSEQRVGEVLAELEADGLIRGYRQTKKNSTDDKAGIDYWIFTTCGRIKLQVKSSKRRADTFNHYHNGEIPVVVGWGKRLKIELLEILVRYLSDA
jgi:hypothetical protein